VGREPLVSPFHLESRRPRARLTNWEVTNASAGGGYSVAGDQNRSYYFNRDFGVPFIERGPGSSLHIRPDLLPSGDLYPGTIRHPSCPRRIRRFRPSPTRAPLQTDRFRISPPKVARHDHQTTVRLFFQDAFRDSSRRLCKLRPCPERGD